MSKKLYTITGVRINKRDSGEYIVYKVRAYSEKQAMYFLYMEYGYSIRDIRIVCEPYKTIGYEQLRMDLPV